MSPGVRAVLLGLIVLAVGLAAVYLEVQNLECGVRVRLLLIEEERLREENRRHEAEINRRLSPDVLAEEIPPEFLAEPGEELIDGSEETSSLVP